MGLSDLTSRDAVLSAVSQFDALGRDAFLSQHGFRKARTYYLDHNGRRYDSKAIAGVAHGIQHPHLGALRAEDFSGGEVTVKRVLEAIGFKVSGSGRSEHSALAFCANPSRYRIRDAVDHLRVDYWLVGAATIQAGDRVAIWQTRDAEGHRGVVALARVIGRPELRTDSDNPYWVSATDAQQEGLRVPVRYWPLAPPLWVDQTETGIFLASLSVAKSQGGTVFYLTNEQWVRLASLSGVLPDEDPVEAEVESVIRPQSRLGTGQGFGLAPAERLAVESYAMEHAKRYFGLVWPVVEDVSRRCSFDLLCSSPSEELRVEVKGTTSSGDRVILTRNEVNEANTPGYSLFVVSDIVVTTVAGTVVATGGTCRVIPRWRPSRHALTPISFEAVLDWNEGSIVDVPKKTFPDDGR